MECVYRVDEKAEATFEAYHIKGVDTHLSVLSVRILVIILLLLLNSSFFITSPCSIFLHCTYPHILSITHLSNCTLTVSSIKVDISSVNFPVASTVCWKIQYGLYTTVKKKKKENTKIPMA